MKRTDRFSPAAILAVLIAIVIVVAILNYALHENAGPTFRESMRLELFKLAMQLVIVVIIGGGIALLYKWIEHSWETTQAQAELRKRYVDRLGDAYRAVKETRRLLRAGGITYAPGASPVVLSDRKIARYDEQLGIINKEQLKLEALKVESRSFPPVDGAASKQLTAEIRTMEAYLGRIIDEYEEFRPRERLDLSQMRRVAEFTGHAGEVTDKRIGTFQENFVHPYYRAIALVAHHESGVTPGTSQRFFSLISARRNQGSPP